MNLLQIPICLSFISFILNSYNLRDAYFTLIQKSDIGNQPIKHESNITFLDIDELNSMHELCSINHDKYSERLTSSTRDNYSFEGMSEQQVKLIADYFSTPILSSTSEITSLKHNLDLGDYEILVLTPQKYTTENIILMQNDIDPDQVILGVSSPQNDKNNNTEMQALFSVYKSSFKIDEPWVLDLAINDDNATCFYCSDKNPLNGRSCSVDANFIRYSAVSRFDIEADYTDRNNVKLMAFHFKTFGSHLLSKTLFQYLGMLCYNCLKYAAFGLILIWNYNDNLRHKNFYSKVRFYLAFSYMIIINCEMVIKNIRLFCLFDISVLLLQIIEIIALLISIPMIALLKEEHLKIKSIDLFVHRDEITITKILILYFAAFLHLILSAIRPEWYTLFYDIWIHPNMYLWLFSHIYLLPIIINIVFKTRYIAIRPICIVIFAVFFAIYPFTIYGHSDIIDGFDYKWVIKFMLFSCIYALILHCQLMYGSWFFLPKYLRQTVYQKYYTFSFNSDKKYRHKNCDVCLNDLDDIEINHIDTDTNYAYKKYPNYVFLKLNCGHVFHPNCLLRRTQSRQKCPSCNAYVPKDE